MLVVIRFYVIYHEVLRTLDIEVVNKRAGEAVFKENGASIEMVLSWLEKPMRGNR